MTGNCWKGDGRLEGLREEDGGSSTRMQLCSKERGRSEGKVNVSTTLKTMCINTDGGEKTREEEKNIDSAWL